MSKLLLQKMLSKQVELSFSFPQNFYLLFEDYPELVFTVQRVQVPTISAESYLQPSPVNPSKTYMPGPGMDYSVLSCDFIVDKEFKNYRSILQWMKNNTAPDFAGEQYGGWFQGMKNCILMGTDPANKPIVEWNFFHAFPISLDGPTFDSTMDQVEYVTSNVTFQYKYFTHNTYLNGVDNNDDI